jgi:GTP1/Obg family GTP-binding protein
MPLQVPTIVTDLEAAVPEIRRLLEEGKQRAEIEHQRWQAQMAEWKRQEEEKRIAKAHKDSVDELRAIIGEWASVKRLEAFFGDAAARLEGLPADERIRIEERLRRAQELLGTTDTLQRFLSWKLPEER